MRDAMNRVESDGRGMGARGGYGRMRTCGRRFGTWYRVRVNLWRFIGMSRFRVPLLDSRGSVGGWESDGRRTCGVVRARGRVNLWRFMGMSRFRVPLHNCGGSGRKGEKEFGLWILWRGGGNPGSALPLLDSRGSAGGSS